MDNLRSPHATVTAFTIEFGSPPLYINPFLNPSTTSTLPSKYTSQYLNRLNTLGFTQSEQAIIVKHNLDWTLCHTKWPAFHWDVDALKSNARDWVGSETETDFDFGADSLSLESRVGDLQGKEMETVVGPTDSTGSSRSRSNLVVAAAVPDPVPGSPIADDSDESPDSPVVNAEPAETISDDIEGEDIPRYGTPDFKILRSSPPSSNPPNNTPIPENIPLPPSRLGSEYSASEYSESVSYGADWDWDWDFDLDFDSEWSSFRSISAFNRSSSSFEFISSFESDSAELDLESAPIEIEETELITMISSSLATLLDLNELDAEGFDQDEIVPTQTEDLDVDGNGEGPVVIYSTSGQEDADISLTSDAGSGPSNPDVTHVEEPTKTPIDPVKLAKLTELSTIPVAGDPSLLLLLSTLPVPPFPESQPQLNHCLTPPALSPTQIPLQIFKKDPELCTKLQIMNTQGTITNEVGAQLRCGCDEFRPVAMKALFGDWDWPLTEIGVSFSKEEVASSVD